MRNGLTQALLRLGDDADRAEMIAQALGPFEIKPMGSSGEMDRL